MSIDSFVETMQVAPTILSILGLDPNSLDAVQMEGTPILPGRFTQRQGYGQGQDQDQQ